MQMLRVLLFLLGTAVLLPPTAGAQTAPAAGPSRWTPWVGCWNLVEESADANADLLDERSGARADRNARVRVCVAPASDGGATITTSAGNTVVSTETIVADGVERPLTDPECRGTQRAEWSTLGPRVFSHAEIACGDAPRRTVHGWSAMMAGPLWFDVQMIEGDGRTSLRVRRYRRAADQTTAPSMSTAREIAAAPLASQLTIAEIAEAAAKTPVPVLQAAVLELGKGGYPLKSQELIALDTAGVPDSVIDLMIAMSYPQRFSIDRASGGGGGGFDAFGFGDELWPFMAAYPYAGMSPFYWGPYGDPMFNTLYGPYYSAYYVPFGFRSWGYFDPRYFNGYGGGGFVVIDPGGGEPQRTGDGRVVDGRGYTRIRRNEPDATPRVNRGNGDGSGWSTASSGANSGSGSSGVSSGGYSSGGSSGSGDRVAVPRPPGSSF